MKNIFSLFLLSLVFLTACKTTNSVTRKTTTKKEYTATKVLSLQMPNGDGVNTGYNGAGLAYHTKNKHYYAVFAGNAAFPLAIFDEKGNLTNKDINLSVGFDARGLWYNPKMNEIEGNGFFEEGIKAYMVKDDAMQYGTTAILNGKHQPSEHSSGEFDSLTQEIVYWNEGKIIRYNRENGEEWKTMRLTNFPSSSTINSNCLIYTYMPGQEIGLLDYEKRKIYLIDNCSGVFSGEITLPTDAPAPQMFNMTFANGYVWLFDVEKRTWNGYKIQ
jgi:hypothetical protein